MYDARDLFERLLLYRQVYALRSRYDAEPVITIGEVMARAERQLRRDRALPTPAERR